MVFTSQIPAKPYGRHRISANILMRKLFTVFSDILEPQRASTTALLQLYLPPAKFGDSLQSKQNRSGPLAMRRDYLLAGIAVVICAGCAQVGVHEQRLVSKPNMQFSRQVAYSYSSKLMPQIQPGLETSGGAQASTCASCK